MAKRESIVPGLGKQQAKVLNNEAGRRAEHKRHLEELGFPKEVDPAFMRYAPVSYDDETPYPSKVVNQAGEDLGFTPKDSLMKSDIQSIVKEAVQEVFISKDNHDENVRMFDDTRFGGTPKSTARDKFPSQYEDTPDETTFDVREEARKRDPDGYLEDLISARPTAEEKENLGTTLAYLKGAGQLGFVAWRKGIDVIGNTLMGINNLTDEGLIVPKKQAEKLQKVINDIKGGNFADAAKELGREGIKKLDDTLEKVTGGITGQSLADTFKTIEVKPMDPDASGVPQVFQPGGFVAGTFQSGQGQTKKEPKQEPPAKSTVTPPSTKQEQLQADPGKIGEATNYGRSQAEMDIIARNQANFGKIGERQIKVEEGTGANKGKLVGTVSGSGTNPYRISINPSDYGGVKAGDTINYNPSKAPNKYNITPAPTTDTGPKKPPVKTPPATKYPSVNGQLLRNAIEKQDGFDYGGFAPGTSATTRSKRVPAQQTPTRRQTPFSRFADRAIPGSPRQGRGSQTPTSPAPKRDSLGEDQTPAPPRVAPPRDQQQDDPKGRYDSVKQRDLQRTPAPPTLKNMQKYQAWLQKAEDEGAMAKVQLDRVSDLASMMHDILEDEDQLPGWIQNKISDSLHNLEASMTHIMYDEKEDRDLVKSKEVFQDFLVRAPQGGGTLLNEEIYLQKAVPIVGALLRIATLGAAPKLFRGLSKLFKVGGKKKKGKDMTDSEVLDTVRQSLEDTGKKQSSKLGKLVLGGAATAASVPFVIDQAKKQGLIDSTEADGMAQDYNNLDLTTQEGLNAAWAQESKRIMQGLPDYLQDKTGIDISNIGSGGQQEPPAQTTQQPSASNQQIGQGMTDAELGRRGATVIKPSYTQPIYDTSPEAEARVRAGGSESIIGAEVDGQKYQFKQPVSNMGQINQALQRATPVREIVKEAIFEISKAKKKGGRKKDPRLERAGVEGYNKPKRTPKHPKKSHIVVAKEGNKIKTIRYGEQGAKTAGDPKKGESAKMKKKRKSFKARHRKNIKRGKMSAAYWADKSKW